MSTLNQNENFASRYLLIQKIGVGGYSEVWKAIDTKAGNLEVALKIFAPEKGLDSKGIEVFSKEYSLVFNLNHKNLLIPKHFDEYEGSPYLVMPYCKEGSVFSKIGEMTEKELARFMQQSASALAYLHSKEPPIIHQDIKPDNFLINDEENYLLTDFGISSKIRRTLTKSMGANASVGTLAYMPPEKFSEDKQMIMAGDIFSLGVTMYELLTGDLPFGEQGGLLLKAGADIPKLPVNFSSEISQILKKCLAKEPWDRPTAKDLEQYVNNYLNTDNWLTKQKKEPETNNRKTKTIPKEVVEQQYKQLSENLTDSSKTELKKKKNTIIFTSLGLIAVITIFIFMYINNSDKKEIAQQENNTVSTIENKKINDNNLTLEKRKIKDDIPDKQTKNEKQTNKQTKPNITDKPIEPKEQNKLNEAINKKIKSNKELKIGDNYAGGIIFELDEVQIHGKVCTVKDQNISFSWEDAKSFCENMNINGYTDWYLASYNELYEMYKNLHKNGLGGFTKDNYWSSTENSNKYAWGQNFNGGYSNYYFKNVKFYVRAIRKF
ncbi:MAG: protein kinase domain-containing protein [Bacteroidales bacterium]